MRGTISRPARDLAPNPPRRGTPVRWWYAAAVRCSGAATAAPSQHPDLNGLCLRRETGLATRIQTDWRFTGCGNKRSKLIRKDSSQSGPLLCGEVFALQLNWDGRGECFRTCLGKPQPAGINICSETCGKDIHYQWQFKGCEVGKPVSPNTPLVLWNTAQQDSLVHGRRPPKIIPTCWAEKVLNGTCLSVH